jgi:4-hydroxythreonine-4-phosphate dehydrogenase
MSDLNKPIAVTMGDPSGIGIEITLKAWKKNNGKNPFFLIHDYEYVLAITKAMKINVPLKKIDSIEDVNRVFKSFLPIYHLDVCKNTQLGKPSKKNARIILKAIDLALGFIKTKKVSAIVTNPVSKEIISYALKSFRGHTEYLAKKSKSKNFCMMLINKTLKVVPLTVHVPLKKVSKLITKKTIKDTLILMNRSLKNDFNIKSPKIIVTGLNPHASDNGLLGNEENKVIKPAINALKKIIKVEGPVAADTAFTPENLKNYDAVLCMYHDQALIPVKTIDFYNTINFTVGLNLVRTSPDHGTGFDIANKFIANESSLIAAINEAARISKSRINKR